MKYLQNDLCFTIVYFGEVLGPKSLNCQAFTNL